MHPDLPIQQLVRRRDTRFQLGFAKEARALLEQDEEFLLAPSSKGLQVLGSNEDALGAPVERLREVYGPTLQVQPPQVRLIEGVQVKQPIMHLRISVKPRFREIVKRALLERGAEPRAEYLRLGHCVLRYEAPLAYLLGLPAELSLLTCERAKHWIVLSHYALVHRDPGGTAA